MRTIITMIGDCKVITLCGSTRFKDEFIETQKRLTLTGNIAISVDLSGHSGDDEAWGGTGERALSATKKIFDDMHVRNNDMADRVSAVNVDGRIGEITRLRTEYAQGKGIPVRYSSDSL